MKTEVKNAGIDFIKFYQNSGLLNAKSFESHKEYFQPYFDIIKKYSRDKGLVLEVACGPGKLLTVLSKISNLKIIATDICPELITIAKKNVALFGNARNVKFKTLDCFELENDMRFPGPYDVIIHHGLLEHFEDANDVIKLINIQRKKCHYVIFGLPYFSQRNRKIWDKGSHKVYRSKWLYEEWKSFLSNNFDVLEVFNFDSKADNIMSVIKGEING